MADDSPSIWDQINGAMNDGTILNAISNPLTSGLAAMAKSFGESSMPTRMPTPFMAALGKATGSALEGVGQGQAVKKAALANQQQQVVQDWFRRKYPNGPPGGGSPMGMPGTGPGMGGGGSNYLTDPGDLVSKGDLALFTGQDRAAAQLYGMPNQMAGGNGYAMGTNNRGFAVPGGSADPDVAARKAGLVTRAEQEAKAPYESSETHKIPAWNPDGTPVLGADGQQQMVDWTATKKQWNDYLSTGKRGGGSGNSTEGGRASGDMLPATTPSQAAKVALASLPDTRTRELAINAMLSSGLPQAAWAPWIAGLHHESGWNLTPKDNQNPNGTYDVGPGQINSGNFGKLGLTDQQLRDPQTNLITSAKMFGQSWDAAKGNPSGAYAHYNTGDVSGTPTKGYLEDTIPRLGKWGYPGVAPSPQPKSTMVAGPAVPTQPPAAAPQLPAQSGGQMPPGAQGMPEPTAAQKAAIETQKEVDVAARKAPIATQQALDIQNQSLIPKAQTEIWQHAAQKDAEIVNDSFKKAATGAPVLATTATIRSMLPEVTTGKSADARLLTSQWASAFGMSEDNAKKYFGTNPVMGELLQKKLFELSTGAVRNMGAREPGSVIGMFQKNYPNMDSRNTTIDAMTRLLDMDQIRNQDYAAAVQGYHNESVKQLNPKEGYRGLSGFESEFDKTNPPKVYVGAALAAGGVPFKDWTHGLSGPEQVQALRLAEKVYPDAAPMNKDGVRHPLVRVPVQGVPNGG